MTTRPTTDGDTKAAIERVQRSPEWHDDDCDREFPNCSCERARREAWDLITTRLSEQEVELEWLRDALKNERRIHHVDVSATPTTQDREGSAPG